MWFSPHNRVKCGYSPVKFFQALITERYLPWFEEISTSYHLSVSLSVYHNIQYISGIDCLAILAKILQNWKVIKQLQNWKYSFNTRYVSVSWIDTALIKTLVYIEDTVLNSACVMDIISTYFLFASFLNGLEKNWM